MRKKGNIELSKEIFEKPKNIIKEFSAEMPPIKEFTRISKKQPTKVEQLAIEIAYAQSKEINLGVDNWIRKIKNLLEVQRKYYSPKDLETKSFTSSTRNDLDQLQDPKILKPRFYSFDEVREILKAQDKEWALRKKQAVIKTAEANNEMCEIRLAEQKKEHKKQIQEANEEGYERGHSDGHDVSYKHYKKLLAKKNKPRFMFVVISEDKVGQTIQLFKQKKQAEIFFKELKK